MSKEHQTKIGLSLRVNKRYWDDKINEFREPDWNVAAVSHWWNWCKTAQSCQLSPRIRNNLKMMSKQPGFQTTREDMHDAADHDMEKENNNKSSF